MPRYWMTIAFDENNHREACKLAEATADSLNVGPGSDHARVVQVDYEPPQGSTIVGDMHEDEL